ncbi:MAG: class I SAM-dependent methyltransferase [Rhodospirillaceae bacterium]|nr:class I SAM-dependent methyltransferase [Rhodospirillaceae bacterium]
MTYEFTNDWFAAHAKVVWDYIVPQVGISAALEVGSYEGASACYLIDTLAKDRPIELHCIDTWHGGIEHADSNTDMTAVERRFQDNTKRAIAAAAHPVNLTVHRGASDSMLAKLLVEGRRNSFDFIYIDGSHMADDVLCDAVLAFRLLKVGGTIAFDDYLWFETLPEGKDPLRCPKTAIDAFVNLHFRKLDVLPAPLMQLFATKLSD